MTRRAAAITTITTPTPTPEIAVWLLTSLLAFLLLWIAIKPLSCRCPGRGH